MLLKMRKKSACIFVKPTSTSKPGIKFPFPKISSNFNILVGYPGDVHDFKYLLLCGRNKKTMKTHLCGRTWSYCPPERANRGGIELPRGFKDLLLVAVYLRCRIHTRNVDHALVVQRADNFIHWISRYLAEQMYCNHCFWQVFHTISFLNLTYTSTVGPLLSGHPPLSGHFPKSRIICW